MAFASFLAEEYQYIIIYHVRHVWAKFIGLRILSHSDRPQSILPGCWLGNDYSVPDFSTRLQFQTSALYFYGCTAVGSYHAENY